MANAFFTQAVVDAEVAAFIVAIDAGSAAIIEIYGDAQPTDADTAIGAQTQLGTLTCSATAATKADDSPGVLLTFNAITDDSSADDTDTATFFRILTQAAGTTIMDGDISTVVAATGDLRFNATAFTAGAAISITSLTILSPES